MKYLSRILAVALLASLTACTSDEPAAVNPGGESMPDGDPLYSTITISSPKGSRSGEANEGQEVGKDHENMVSSILVVLATYDETAKKYEYLGYAENDSKLNNKQHVVVFRNKQALLERAEAEAAADRKVYVFAYCNPTAEFVQKMKETSTEGFVASDFDFVNLVCGTDAAGTWGKNYFLMTNVGIHFTTLPPSEELKKFNSPSNALNLGEIEVVRTASRFDIRDGSPASTDEFTYNIKDYLKEDVVIANVTFDKLAVFNVRDQFYYLPRIKAAAAADEQLCPGWIGMDYAVGADGRWTNPFVVCPDVQTYGHSLEPRHIIDPASEPELNWKNIGDIATEENEDNWGDADADTPKDTYYIFEGVS